MRGLSAAFTAACLLCCALTATGGTDDLAGAARHNPLLQPFLQYDELRSQWHATSDRTIAAFIDEHKDYFFSNDLRRRWLHRLVKQNKWRLFDDNYSEAVADVELECYELNRRLRRGESTKDVVERSLKIWRSAADLPDSCTPLFRQLQRQGKLHEAEVWERIRLTVRAGRDKLARYVEQNFMPPKQRNWVSRWVQARRNPHRELLSAHFPLAGQYSVEIIVDALEQQARTDPEQAELIWRQLLKKKHSLAKHAPEVYAVIGFRAAINHNPDATQWLQRASFAEERVRHWALRAAMREGHWKELLTFYQRLEPEERQSPEWRYWQARALAATGKRNQAEEIYRAIAGERDYYSFLAADKIGADYDFNDHPIQTSTQQLAQSRPFRIAHALAGLDDPSRMRRQWDWAIRNLDEAKLPVAAKLAQQWKLYDRAIATAGRARYYDDIQLRFPVLFEPIVRHQAQVHQVPLAHVYGIIRQESAFMADVRSPAGALGLMQIMPRTGRMIARKQRRGRFSTRQLLQPEINVAMGTYYLRDLLGRFNGNFVMATAAYNAGPLRPDQWQALRPLDADVWIETIPFGETRHYVKNVLSYQVIYRQQLGLPHEPLIRLMKTIPPGGSAMGQ